MSSGGLELLTIKIQKMTIESTDLQNSTTPAITYSECYQQCFCSDNLELMKTIESNTVDLIYCDILYGTGKKFKDYQDLKPIRSEIEQHYIPRIKEMHRILKDTGSIYLQMDYRINHWVRLIMDDIFGYDNFQNEIIWYYKNSALKAKSNKFRQNTDNIYYYSKNKGKHTWNDIFEKCEPYKASKHKFNSETQKAERLRNENGKIDYFFVDEIKQDNLFQINALNSNENTKYNTQKPKELIGKFIKASSNEGDLVADFYLGSGTTAEVCKDLKRNFIGCDINPRAIEITLQRLNDARS
jgi:site-specific DNA-methyltransferase (adenine-specific)